MLRVPEGLIRGRGRGEEGKYGYTSGSSRGSKEAEEVNHQSASA